MAEKTFFNENENRLVSISIWKKSVEPGRFKMYFHEGVTRELQTLYTVFTRVSARGAHLILISQRWGLLFEGGTLSSIGALSSKYGICKV